MAITYPCAHCGFSVPAYVITCPHCAQPVPYPNVRAAEAERADLQARYDDVISDADARGVRAQVEEFEEATRASRAVFNRYPDELYTLAKDEKNFHATFYHRRPVKLPDGDDWDLKRRVADDMFFTNYAEDVGFAALTLDSTGVLNYGNCSIILKDSMISHRASVFVENTVSHIVNERIVAGDPLAKGLRAIWDERARLCVVKLGGKITSATLPAGYAGLVIHQGASGAEDDFIEVHIFGEITVKTFEEVTLPEMGRLSRRERDKLKGIREKLLKHGVKVN